MQSDRSSSQPHAADVEERKTLDGGFSQGLGLHFQPSEDYWFDAHTHVRGIKTASEVVSLLDSFFGRLEAYRLGRILALIDEEEGIDAVAQTAAKDPRLEWLLWLQPDEPDLDRLKKAVDRGAIGLKLHNVKVIKGHFPHDVWLSDAWARVFDYVAEAGLPVLWHVTQRIGGAPYHGGGAHSYWSEGWKNGVSFTNEDLLQVFLQVMKNHPRLIVQGAHQLHLGLGRLAELFDAFPNLHIDTSCTMFVRWADLLYDKDRQTYRDFFLKYPDRILFGSDTILRPAEIDEYLFQGFLCHSRFVNQLRLSEEVLQNVAHHNAERLYRLAPMELKRRGTVRP